MTGSCSCSCCLQLHLLLFSYTWTALHNTNWAWDEFKQMTANYYVSETLYPDAGPTHWAWGWITPWMRYRLIMEDYTGALTNTHCCKNPSTCLKEKPEKTLMKSRNTIPTSNRNLNGFSLSQHTHTHTHWGPLTKIIIEAVFLGWFSLLR